MLMMNSIQIRSRDAGMPIVLLLYSSARVAKVTRWPWVVPSEPGRNNLKTKEGILTFTIGMSPGVSISYRQNTHLALSWTAVGSDPLSFYIGN